MPVPTTTRSGRTVKNSSNKQSKLDALELLDRQRRGEKVDLGVREEPELFDYIEEDEYQRTSGKGAFVECEGSDDEYGQDDDDFIDDQLDDDDEQEEKGSNRNRKKTRGRPAKELELDPRQTSMKRFMGAPGTSKTNLLTSSSASIMKSEKKPHVDPDDILKNMLLDVPSNPNSSVKKPLARIRDITRPASIGASPKLITSASTPTPFRPTPTKLERSKSPLPSSSSFLPSPPLRSHSPTDIKPHLNDTGGDQPYKKQRVESPHFMDSMMNDDQPISYQDKECTHFYWYDCCEGPTQGTVHFFGRIQQPNDKFVSCCVIVKNVKRSLYLLISPNCTYEEVVGEFSNITAKRYKIRDFTCKKATKKFAFDSTVPIEADYVLVDYPANQSKLPVDLKGETFCKVLNTNQSPMEKMILDLKLRGPAWLRLIEPKTSSPPITWSRVELVLESPAHLLVEEIPIKFSRPYFCVLSLALQTYAHPNIAGRNEIIAISVMVNTCFRLDQCLTRNNKGCGHFMIMAKPGAAQRDPLRLPYDFLKATESFQVTRLEVANNERELLVKFMEKFNQFDPDIVVGHDLLNYDLETLIRQMIQLKVGAWDKLGRFKRNTLPSSRTDFHKVFGGRVLCDIKKSAEELMQLRSYDLTELASKILDKKRVEYNYDSIVESYKTSESLMQMLDATWQDVDSIFSIFVELNIIPLALKITNITGNVLSRTLIAGRSERNEYLLLHAFHEDNFICPDKVSGWDKKANVKNMSLENGDEPAAANHHQGRRKAAYTGGLVLDPKTGFYESCILLMDFNSLYPSIIQEFNICFSTVREPPETSEEGTADIPSDSADTGILPAQLRSLVKQRREVKARMKICKDPLQITLLDIEQKALKLTANSMYGCLGFEYSRFYAKHLASLVTSKGREILMNTKGIVESLGYEVIYGDTDSLMIDTKLVDFQEVLQRGRMIKDEINRRFKLLEIDVDGLYQPLLLLKKKNYAGTSIDLASIISSDPNGQLVKKIETKGLDSVRRDRAVIAKEASERVLAMILQSDKETCLFVEDIHKYLKDLAEQVNRDEIPVEKYLISKQLNKKPEEYRDTKGLGHVTIARRLNEDPKTTRKLKAGDVISYVVCLDGTGESANQRGYTLEEMTSNPNLKVDHEYYLCQQIYPALSRICDKLPFTNAYSIAEAMGIESNSSVKIPRDITTSAVDQLVSKGEQRFAACKPLVIECPACCHIEEIRTKAQQKTSLAKCSSCHTRLATVGREVVVQMIAHIKRMTLSLYNSRFTCPDCGHSTRNIFGPQDEQGKPVCMKCSATLIADMDDRLMDLHLSYYKYLMDIQNGSEPTIADGANTTPPELTSDTMDMHKKCFDEVLGALKMSFINTFDAQRLFSMVCSGGALRMQ